MTLRFLAFFCLSAILYSGMRPKYKKEGMDYEKQKAEKIVDGGRLACGIWVMDGFGGVD